MAFLKRIDPPETAVLGVGDFSVGTEREVPESLAREFDGLPGWRVRGLEPPPKGKAKKEE